MPANSADGVAHIEGSLKASLGRGDSNDTLQQQLTASSKKVLLQKVEFQPAAKETSFQLDSLRTKYTSLNPGVNVNTVTHAIKEKDVMNRTVLDDGGGGEGLPAPKVVLYPTQKVKLDWGTPRRVGAGLVNLGNTCFLNSTLQCLTYCPPLSNYLLSGEHESNCKLTGFCMLCELQRHLKRCQENNTAIRPASILQKLKMIAKHMTWGRQEDAHEFLRYVIDAMQKSCISPNSKLDKYSKETTVVNQIFGGFLRSQVLCLKCKERSNTYDPFMDISLDIKNVQNVQKALERFVMAETLDNDNAYNCPRCKSKVPAQKRFTIHRAPNVLTLQLKRFDFNRFPMGKISKHVAFPDKLDLRPYMSIRQGGPLNYQLFAVLVHIGGSCNSGHYYCYAKAPNLMWHCLNDSSVQPAGLNRVLNADAYLLFYVKMKESCSNITPQHQQQQQNYNGNGVPNVNKQKLTTNGSHGGTGGDVGVPLERKPFTAFTPRSLLANKPSSTPSSIALPGQRDKVSFGLKSHQDKEKQFGIAPKATQKPSATVTSSAQLEDPDGKDSAERIVLTIKKGKVYHGSLENLKEPGRNGQTTGLVPYNGESSDDEGSSPKPNGEVDHGKSNGKETEPVFDQRLNATINVPGAYKPLDQESVLHKKDAGPAGKERRSPVKRSASDSGVQLTLNLATSSPVKVNATTSWNVLDQDAQVSPSLASNSSTTSVNSTGNGWQVTSKELRKLSVLPEAARNGWTVTPLKDQKEEHSNNTDSTASMRESPTTDTMHTHSTSETTANTAPLIPNGSKAAETSTQHDKSGPQISFTSLLGACAGSTVDSDSEHHRKREKKKKKKKKKHKKRRDSDDSSLLDSPTDSSGHRRPGDDPRPSKKGRHSSDEEGESYVWVERTKESLQDHKTDKAPAQSWDHHIKDGYKKKEDSSTAQGTSNTTSKWDGSRSYNVVSQLERPSNRGYGTKVMTWDGGKTELDQQAAREAKQNKKRHWNDEYEEDLDRGTTKKVKSQNERSHYYGNGNPFQQYQEHRYSDNETRRSGDWYRHGGQHSRGYSGFHGNQNYNNGHYRNSSGHYRSGSSYYDRQNSGGNRSFSRDSYGHRNRHQHQRWV